MGRCSAAAGPRPTRPAPRPAVIPQTITAPAAGTARRLAGSEARGSGPKAASSRGATPSCAAIVTPRGSVHHAGPGSAALTTGPSLMMASEAATDSWNPSDPTRSGSTTNSSVTATASTRTRAIGRPTVRVTAAMAAIAAALDTDGSKRVMQREQRDDGQDERQPWPQAQASADGSDHGEHEGHVLPRHRQEVGEAGAAEVVGERCGLGPVVADHQAGEERPVDRAERRRAVGQRTAEAVGEGRHRAGRRPGLDASGTESSSHVAHDEPRRRTDHRRELPGDADVLPCQPGRQARRRSTRRRRAPRGGGPGARRPGARRSTGSDPTAT